MVQQFTFHNKNRLFSVHRWKTFLLKGAYLKANPSLHTHTPFYNTLKRRQRRIHHRPLILKLRKNPGSRKLLQIPNQFSPIKICDSSTLVCAELFKCTSIRTIERPNCSQRMSVEHALLQQKISPSLWTPRFSVSSN